MKVIIRKSDLDTCLTGLILGVDPKDEVIAVRADADPEDLRNPRILCIEVGGAGQVEKLNFDHHDTMVYLPPACKQAYEFCGKEDKALERLVRYVSIVDECSSDLPAVGFPTLSNLFSGMLFVEKGALARFRAGMEMLKIVLDEHLDPFGTMPILPHWKVYVDAKLENQRRIMEVLKNAEFYTTRSGLRVGYLEHEAIGGIGALYEQGCQVVILLNEQFGEPPISKFTIAGNQVPVGNLLPLFDKLEKGWGGTKTILGSPRDRSSKLTKEQVLKIIREGL